MRAESARRVYSPRRGYGYPNVPALNRTRSQDRFVGRTKASGSEDDQETGGGGGRVRIRNIEIPERDFGDMSTSPVAAAGRPSTAPVGGRRRRSRGRRRRSSGRRSPSHPNYKDDVYLKSKVKLRYVGHPEKDQSPEVSWMRFDSF